MKEFEKISFFNSSMIIDCENVILTKLDWNIMFAIPYYFIELMIEEGIVYLDDQILCKKLSQNEIDNLVLTVNAVHEMTLYLNEMSKYSSIVIALTCIIISRKICNVRPLWNNKFSELTGLKYEDISSCHKELIE